MSNEAKRGITRRDLLKIVPSGVAAVILVAYTQGENLSSTTRGENFNPIIQNTEVPAEAPNSNPTETDSDEKNIKPSELIASSLTVSERIMTIYGIDGMDLNPQFDQVSDLSSEDNLASALLVSLYERWKRTTGKDSDVSLKDYSQMLTRAHVIGNHSDVMFNIAGADRSIGRNNVGSAIIDPLKEVEIVASDPIHEGFLMNLRVDTQYSRYKTNDYDISGSAVETYIDRAYYGFARRENGGLQIMFNLGSPDWSSPTSSKSLTGRLKTALTLLTFIHYGSNSDYKELGIRASRRNYLYEPLLFADNEKEIGVLAPL